MRWRRAVAALPFLALMLALMVCPGARAEGRLELRGELLDSAGKLIKLRRVQVRLHSNTAPFTAGTEAFFGKFRFRKLEPGSYTITAAGRGTAELRETVVLSASQADSRGRIEMRFTLRDNPSSLERRMTVNAHELAVPFPAEQDFRRALEELGKPGDDHVRKAIDFLERAIQRAPQFVRALNYLGTIYYHRREFDKAATQFRRALEVDATAYEPLVNLGGTLLSMERYDEALVLNRNAVAARPDDALAHAQLGLSFFALKQYDRAVEHLVEAKRLDAEHFSNPQLTLAEIYLRLARPGEAAAELEEFLRLHPDYPNAANMRKGIENLRKRPN